MQVDPIRPSLKAPGTKRLKLNNDEPLQFAFNFGVKCNLRRFNQATCSTSIINYAPKILERSGVEVRRCRLTQSNPLLKAPMVSAIGTII